MAARKRAAVDLRVSTEEQTLDNQRADIKRVLRVRGLRQVTSFEEHVSAARARPEFDAMMEAAHRGEFDVIVVWALDRFGRSMVGNLQAVLDLDRCGVEVISVSESWLDTGGPVRPLLIAIFGWVAEQERVRLGERTKAGLERARRQGVVIGRPRRSIDIRRAESLLDKGHSLRRHLRPVPLRPQTGGRPETQAWNPAHPLTMPAQAPLPYFFVRISALP